MLNNVHQFQGIQRKFTITIKFSILVGNYTKLVLCESIKEAQIFEENTGDELFTERLGNQLLYRVNQNSCLDYKYLFCSNLNYYK